MEKKCSADGCERDAKTKGYCQKHYLRFLKYDDANYTKRCPPDTPIKDRLIRNRDVDENGCWIWTGYIEDGGYGVMHVKDVLRRTHIWSYETFVGEIPEGLVVCHKCDVKTCFNPDHLFLGTLQDNVADMVKKGRTAKGENHSKAKLKNDQVIEIYKTQFTGLTNTKAAEMYGVTQSVISKIRNKKIWTHILQGV